MAEPITLAQAKLHMRIDPDDTSQDSLIDTYITANRQYLEKYLNLSLIPKEGLTYNFKRGCTCTTKYCYIPYGPVTSFEVKDKSGETLTYENLGSEEFPKLCVYKDAYITYNAGYADGEVPEQIQLALLMMVADSYENRESTVVGMAVNQIPFNAKQLVYNFSRNTLL